MRRRGSRRDAFLDLLLGRGLLPDPVLRAGVRVACARRLRHERRGSAVAQERRRRRLAAELAHGPMAARPEIANEQHYEVPVPFFEQVLGPRLKYSCCFWPEGTADLGAAEEAMLGLSCERAGMADGLEVLDLGCGWGSLALWIAERYPAARVLAVSNSQRQREFIVAAAARRGLDRVEAVCADIAEFRTERRFDRVFAIEAMEYLTNWEAFLAAVAGWLRPEGRLFVHAFTHRRFGYRYEGSWMARNFFGGGLMPSHDLLTSFQRDLVVAGRWAVSGTHFERTARAWLERLDANAGAAKLALADEAGGREARRDLARWRLFFLACEGTWGYRDGNEWQVSHYVLEQSAASSAPARSH